MMIGAAPCLADNDRMDGNVVTFVCRVDTTFITKSGDSFTGTGCFDGKRNCNDAPGSGYCDRAESRPGVSRSCAWVALSMCHSE